MEQRTLISKDRGNPREVSVVGLGTWQLGADWGDVSEADARAVLEASVGAGVTFLDTADVYGDGRSEQIVGRFAAEHPGVTVATKMGRRMDQVPENYTLDHFRAWTDRSRRNLGVDTLDLVQLHCPPTEVVEADRVYDDLDTLVSEGAVAAYGLSVETCDQALAAIARPGVATVQIPQPCGLFLRRQPSRRMTRRDSEFAGQLGDPLRMVAREDLRLKSAFGEFPQRFDRSRSQ